MIHCRDVAELNGNAAKVKVHEGKMNEEKMHEENIHEKNAREE